MEPETLQLDARTADPAAGRRLQPEIMDDPGLDPAVHRRALAGLARINRLSLAANPVWRAITPLAATADGPLRLLDVATGGGDVAVALWKRAARAGVELEITALDVSPIALEVARGRAEAAGAALQLLRADVLERPLPPGHDVVVSTLFFHHLAEVDAVGLLGRMASAARRAVVVADLRRCRSGTLLARLAPPLLTRSDVVRVDAVRSARAALSTDELEAVALAAGLRGARIERSWPARQVLFWERPE